MYHKLIPDFLYKCDFFQKQNPVGKKIPGN